MSEIDFAEIEKAMAELVNKAQGKERQKGLSVVSKERSEKAKEVETAHEQGDIATKRIIVASNSMRSNPHPKPQVSSVPVSPPATPPSSGRVMDFKVSLPAQMVIPKEPEYTSTSEEEEDLNKTVGELSNEYLMEKVSEPKNSLDLGDKGEDENESENEEPDNSYFSREKKEEELEESEESNSEDVPEQPEERSASSRLEDIAGPAPVMSVMQEPGLSGRSGLEDTGSKQDELPEADELAEDEDIGKVHKIYGQRLPREYLTKPKKNHEKAEVKTKVSRPKSKRGSSFYLVLLMALVAVGVWAGAAYLFFAS